METIKLDLIPGKKMPSLHASQYDDGREHGIDLFENGVVYKLDGTETLTINERKGDDCICSLDIENTFAESNHIVFASTEQMCAVWGNNICELVIAKGEKTIGTLNFILEVEPSPTEGGIESESEIKNLERQIEEITEEVIGEDYYTKTQTNEAIATAIEGKADTTYVDTELAKKADKNNTYTKTEVDDKLSEKANADDVYQKTETYSKTETDNLVSPKADKTYVDTQLQTKANANSVYTKTQVDNKLSEKADADNTYTKEQVDDIVYNILPDDTASGAIANFNTSLELPIKSLEVDVNAVQESGTPTPEAPLPISGFTEANITRVGNNVWGGLTMAQSFDGKVTSYALDTVNKTFTFARAQKNPQGDYYQVLFDKLEPNIQYTLIISAERVATSGNNMSIVFRYTDGTTSTACSITSNEKSIIIQTSLGGKSLQDVVVSWIGPAISKVYYDESGLFEGILTEEDFEPYLGEVYNIPFVDDQGEPLTVFGGSLNVTTGTLRVTHGNIESYNGETINEPWISSMDEYSQGATPTTGAQVVYPLTTPYTIALPDGEPIITLNGTNNIYADTGDTEVVFKSSVNDYVSAHSGGNLLGMGGVYLGGAKSGGSEEEPDEGEDTEKVKLDETKEEVKTIGDTKKLGGE